MRRARDGCPFEDAIRPAVEERMRGSYQTLSEKDGRRDAALERGGWDAVGSGLWRGCWDVRVGPSSVAWESWINCLTIRRMGACGVSVEKKDRVRAEVRRESEVCPGDAHGGRSR